MEEVVGFVAESGEEDEEVCCCCCDEDLRPVSASQKDIVDYRGLFCIIMAIRRKGRREDPLQKIAVSYLEGTSIPWAYLGPLPCVNVMNRVRLGPQCAVCCVSIPRLRDDGRC